MLQVEKNKSTVRHNGPYPQEHRQCSKNARVYFECSKSNFQSVVVGGYWNSVTDKHTVDFDGLDENWLSEMLSQSELNPNPKATTVKHGVSFLRQKLAKLLPPMWYNNDLDTHHIVHERIWF